MREDIKERIELIRMGKVPEGYKKTIMGIFPKTWEVVQITECIDKIESGTSVVSNGVLEKTKCSILKTSAVKDGVLDINESKGIKDEDACKLSCSLKQGTIIICRSNTPDLVGACCYSDREYANIFLPDILWQIYNLSICKTNFLWLTYLLNTIIYQNKIHEMASGTSNSMKKIAKKNFEKLLIIRPTIKEQNKMANILFLFDKMLLHQRNIIIQKRQQKKSIMRKLFDCSIKTEGRIEKWHRVKLGEILMERECFTQKSDMYEHVTLSKEGIIPKNSRYDREHLVKNEEKEYKITYLNDICYNPANLKFGVICRNTYGDAIFSPIYVTFEVNPMYDIGFVSQFVTRWDFINAVRKYEEGTVYERMSVKPEDFLKFEVTLPELEEQKAIARVLSMADKEIELLEKKLELIKQEKKAMMQLLLTGIVRISEEKMEVD